MSQSGEDLSYIDPVTNERYVPYCIEPSLGADRVTLAFLIDAYDEEALEDGTTRSVLRFHPALAPFKAAVLPLTKKLSEPATELYQKLAKHFMVDYDEAGSIGKRYRRHDEIGTPCASPSTSIPWRTTASPSGTGTPWIRCGCPWTS